MICRSCKREIVDNSIYCNWCGTKQLKKRAEKKELAVPVPRQLPSGKWFVQLRLNGKSISITEQSELACKLKATQIKTDYLNGISTQTNNLTLSQMIDRYIEANSNILSPSTVRGYRAMQRSYIQNVMHKPYSSIKEWQSIINDMTTNLSPKTIKNAWRFFCTAMRFSGITPPTVNLPKVQSNAHPFLEPEQIKIFIKAIAGERCEIPALLALHSLRRSELLAVTPKDIDLTNMVIHVNKTLVLDQHNNKVYKDTNKTNASRRTVPIMIPELEVALASILETADESKPIVQMHPDTLRKLINRICRKNDLPEIGAHGLRHSFASLAYHLGLSEKETMDIGGWSDTTTMHKIYTHLAQSDRLKAKNVMAEFYAQ